MPNKLATLLAALAVAGASGVSAEDARVLTAHYPEGPLWRGERLYFAEMRADRVTLSDEEGVRAFFTKPGSGPTAIAPYGDGFLILCHLSADVVAVDALGRELRRWNHDNKGAPLTNPNDASADGQGGVYFSDSGPFSKTARPQGRIMHLSADGVLRKVAGPLKYPNGVHVKGDALYVSEHLRGRILRYDIKAGADLGGATVFADLSGLDRPARYQTKYALSGPDGLEFGPDGALYVAVYGEGRLLKFSSDGKLLNVIEQPMRFLTNLAFGPTGAAFTGTFDIQKPPFRGEVRIETGLP